MKNINCFIVFILTCFFSLNAQEKKYQSLLWEVSGKDLTKKSYIYGTMHVSDKVSYHLSDAFYEHLLNADMVANESDPATWHDMMHLYDYQYPNVYESGFYKKFYQRPIDKSILPTIFLVNDYMMNNLLFRTNNFRSEYQEETYLDMFIYQAARKFNKKNVGLEDAFESMKLMTTIDYQNIKPDLEKQQKLTKLLNGKSVEELMKDYYREKNLDMLDSLMVLSSPPAIMDAMLFKRNVIMTKSMDSLMKKGSLFAAVGAAHIPGKKGMVELLRAKGYTVNPVFSEYTDKGKNQKKLVDQTFVQPKFSIYTSSDGLISAKLLESVQIGHKVISSPDLSNGSFTQIKRFPLNDFLLDKNKRFNHKSLDSLFFENIQGEILSKKIQETKHFIKYDIKNKTKAGDFQRHQFYVTPLEIISLSFIGKLNFIELYDQQIFDNFKLNIGASSHKIVQPNFSSFTIEMPSFCIIYGDNEFKSTEQVLEIQGYENDSFFLFYENFLSDFNYLENTNYELNRIQDEYLIEVDALDSKNIIQKSDNTLISQAKIKDQESYLKTIIHGHKYYLLLAVNSTQNEAFKYFDSFKIKDVDIKETFKTYIDTANFYTIDLPYRHNQQLFLQASTKSKPLKNGKETNYFVEGNESVWIKSKSSDKVLLEISKFHKYFSVKHVDSLVADYKKLWVKDTLKMDSNLEVFTENLEEISIDESAENELIQSEEHTSYYSFYSATNIGNVKSTWDDLLNFKKENFKKNYIENDKFYFDEKRKVHVYEGKVCKEGSQQAIKFKYFIKDGITYELKTLVDKKDNKSKFFDEIDKNFKPLDTIFSKSMYKDKFDEFLVDAKSPFDSIRYSAMNSICYLKIESKDFNKVIDFINTFEFKANEKHSISQLLSKINDIKGKETTKFFKNIYKENTDNANIQLAILEALANQKNSSAYKIIEELLNFDLPISNNSFAINRLFSVFSKDYKNSYVLMPNILNFYSIKDYHDAIFNFVSELNKQDMIAKKHLKNIKSMFLVNAKIEYKRVLAWQISQELNQYDYQNLKTYDATLDLIKYIHLLSHYKQDTDVKYFLNKCLDLNIKEVLIAFAEIEKHKQGKISKDLENRLLGQPQTLFTTYMMLSKSERLNQSIPPNELIESVITIIDDINHEKENMTFLFEKQKKYGSKSIRFYFYKFNNKEVNESMNAYDNEPKLLSIGFVLDNQNNVIYDSFYSGLQKGINDEDKLDELANEVIDESLNQNKPRVTFGKTIPLNGFGFGEMIF